MKLAIRLRGLSADWIPKGFVPPPETGEAVRLNDELLNSSFLGRRRAHKSPHPWVGDYGPVLWYYRGKIYEVDHPMNISDEDVALRLIHHIMKQTEEISRIRKEVEAFKNFDRLPSARRERVPDAIRMFVWQRDGGTCVECNSRERLEFDHIIPVAEGGATTERNIQLLCETCNRRKGRRI